MARADAHVLAIDQGTSSTKAVLVDQAGVVVAKGTAPLEQQHPRPGWVDQSPDEIWESVRAAVAHCMDGRDPHSVLAVGVSNQRESLVLWDRDTGKPLAPMVSWQDQRTAAACADLIRTGAGARVREVSGLPLDPMFSATKAAWLLDLVDPDRRRARRGELCLGTVDSWLLSRLGGEPVVEVGNAARTQLLDIRRRQWDPGLLELFGVPVDVLPRVVASTGPFPAVRGLAPLVDGTPVAAVMGDSHAALFAHAGWLRGRVKATYGTGSSVMGLADLSIDLGPELCSTIAWETERPAYAVEGNIRSSGATLTWLADLVGGSPARIAALAAGASADGVHLVPAFGGLGAPWWDADAVGTASGLTLGSRLPQLARAALESIAFQVDDVVSAVADAVGPVEVLLADGGAAANSELMQLQADLGGRRVERSLVGDLSALGAAHLAGLAIGLWSESALEALGRPSDRFLPQRPDEWRRTARGGWHAAVSRSRLKQVNTA